MAQSLVGSYNIATTNNQSFVVDFSIPDNCEYTVTQIAGIVTIRVQLKAGQTKPSTTFIACKQTFTTTTESIAVDFEQVIDANTILFRPKIRIDG